MISLPVTLETLPSRDLGSHGIFHLAILLIPDCSGVSEFGRHILKHSRIKFRCPFELLRPTLNVRRLVNRELLIWFVMGFNRNFKRQ